MHPVAGILELDHLGGLEELQAAILLRVRSPAFLAVDQQGRTGDARPQRLDVGIGHVVGRVQPDIVVKLPAIGAVLVLVDALLGQMTGLLGGEVLVLLLHALERLLDRGIAPRQPPGELTLFLDPFLHALGQSALGRALGDHLRRRPQPFDRDQFAHAVRKEAGVAERDIATEGMRDDRDRRQRLLMDELRQVVDVRRHLVVPVGRPLAVAMPAQVRADDVPIAPQLLRDPVPVPAMVAPAVNEEKRRRVGIAPIDIVHAQTLGDEVPGSRPRHAVEGTHETCLSPSVFNKHPLNMICPAAGTR